MVKIPTFDKRRIRCLHAQRDIRLLAVQVRRDASARRGGWSVLTTLFLFLVTYFYHSSSPSKWLVRHYVFNGTGSAENFKEGVRNNPVAALSPNIT